MKPKLNWKGCLLALAITAILCVLILWLLFDRAMDGLFETMTDIPVDTTKEYFHKSSAGIEYIEQGSGIQLPENHKIQYIIEGENLLPPFMIEAHIILQTDGLENFIEKNSFREIENPEFPLDFLFLTDELPTELKPVYSGGRLYVTAGGNDADSEVGVWWNFLLNTETGELWINYSTE